MNDIIIFDGAFGTYISSMGILSDSPESANITHPDVVRSIHREYISCGVNAIKTNTFAANPALIGDNDRLRLIITKGYEIACSAADGTDVKVFADIGPISCENAEEYYISVADIFIKCGAVNFLFETLSDFQDVKPAIRHIRANVKNALIITSFAIGQDGYSRTGSYYTALFEQATAGGADIVGMNCICGPAHTLNLLKQTDIKKYNIIAMPNSGYPSVQNQRTVYVDNPNYFANKLFQIYSLGVKAVGGCCGTTPKHIAEFVFMLKSGIPETAVFTAQQPSVGQTQNRSFDTPFIAVELAAPVDTDTDYVLTAARAVKEAGADFVTIPDSPLGKTRANSFMISSLITRKTGIRTIPHICCRDKNQIAAKGDLIGGSIEGISTVLAITGDAISEADRGDAKNVFGFNSLKLISFVTQLNDTVFSSNPYAICAALNINAVNFEAELNRARKKIENGAVCLFTQPIFTQSNIDNYRRAKADLNCKIAVGIMPLAGYKNALFLNNEVPGIEIPDEIISSLEGKDPEQSKQICIDYSKSIIDKIKDDCDGYYIMTPLKKYDFSAELIKYIKEINQ